MRTIVVSGALANKPGNGGNAWTRLSWVRGFRELGFEVCFVEELARGACVDERGERCEFAQSANRAYFDKVAADFQLTPHASLIAGEGEGTWGRSLEELQDIARGADLLFNIGGHLRIEPLRSAFRRAVYFDDDPGYTQFWQVQGTREVAQHDHYFTVGSNLGKACCGIPTAGLRWQPTRPPVTLADWPESPGGDPNRLTTVASWRGPYGPIEHDGMSFGLKAHEFRKFAALPGFVPQSLEVALDIDVSDGGDLDLLHSQGWRVVDPRQVAASPAQFRDYVQGSGGEFSAAQGIYVQTRSGWFSDRTVKYLASGNPVLVQDTGFSDCLPVGDGLLAFHTVEEAADGARRIARDYAHHRAAARQIAENYFDARLVLSDLLERIGIAP